MPAFTDKKLDLIQKSIETLYDRAILHYASPQITNDEIYNMLVDADDKADLQNAENIIDRLGIYGLARSLNNISPTIDLPAEIPGEKIELSIYLEEPIKRLLPAYAATGFRNITPQVKTKIDDWVKTRYTIGCSFSGMWQYVRHMNHVCENPGQIKFYFKGLTSLLEMTDDKVLKAMADRLNQQQLPKSYPRITRAHQDAGKEYTRAVAWAMLFPKDGAASQPVRFSIVKGKFRSFFPAWTNYEIQCW